MLSTVGIPSSTLLKAVMAVIETSQKKGILSKLGLSLCGKFLTLFCAAKGRPQSVTIQMKGNEEYLPVVLFIYLFKAANMFESVHDES